MKKTIEVLSRRDCSRCGNKKPHGYIFSGSHGRESFVDCLCVPKYDNPNIAGRGKEMYWQEVEVDVPDTSTLKGGAA